MIFAAFVIACIKQCEGYGLDPRNTRVPYQLKLIILLLFFFPSKQQQMEYEMRIPKKLQSGTTMMVLNVVSSVYPKWGGRFSELCSSLPEVFIMRIREQSEHMITNELQNTACQVEESGKKLREDQTAFLEHFLLSQLSLIFTLVY